MKTFLKHMRFVGLALALALIAQPVLSTMTPTTAEATISYNGYPQPVFAGAGGLSGGSGGGVLIGYLVGGVFVSVASLMFCAGYVGNTEGREMTYAEAKLAAWFPLHCLWGALLNTSTQ